MIVWGGYIGGSSFGTGGCYDPSTDTWRPTSLGDAPTPRSAHTAVWTGSAMVLWGGHGAAPPYDYGTGAVYNPVTDTWVPISTSSDPEGRYRAAAVWTGSEMLVFGGVGGDGFATWSNGGCYCAADADGDGFLDAHDCAPDDATTWTAPGEARDLTLAGQGPTQIAWDLPIQPGASEVSFDLLRSGAPDDFTGSVCLVSDTSVTSAVDAATPDAGSIFSYLVRVTNACGSTVGSGSDGSPRSAGPCP
jgi:hypothetical protein